MSIPANVKNFLNLYAHKEGDKIGHPVPVYIIYHRDYNISPTDILSYDVNGKECASILIDPLNNRDFKSNGIKLQNNPALVKEHYKDIKIYNDIITFQDFLYFFIIDDYSTCLYWQRHFQKLKDIFNNYKGKIIHG